MIRLLNYIKFNLAILKNLFILADKKIKFVFYSENKFYQKYSVSMIDLIAKKYSEQIYYVSSDIYDKIDNQNVKNLFIGSGFFMKIFFYIIKAEYFFLTLTDLDNHYIKRNKFVGKYIYYFHGAGSTFKGYTKRAFDNYDIVLCNGQFQANEIKFNEVKKNLKKKKLILTGYFYLDYISKKINKNRKTDEILLAPSWTYKHKNFINENCINLIDELIKNKHNVCFRPHPEHFKRSKRTLKNIQERFSSNKNFRFDDDPENISSMERAKCLITENSGFLLEFMLTLDRPVLFLDDGIDKIHNENYADFKDFLALEVKFRNEFCETFSGDEIKNIDMLIKTTLKSFPSKIPQLNILKNSAFSNLGKTIEEFEKILDNQILD